MNKKTLLVLILVAIGFTAFASDSKYCLGNLIEKGIDKGKQAVSFVSEKVMDFVNMPKEQKKQLMNDAIDKGKVTVDKIEEWLKSQGIDTKKIANGDYVDYFCNMDLSECEEVPEWLF